MVSILPTAMVASAAIPAATSLIGGSQQAAGANAATQAQMQIYQQNQQLLNPYVQQGLGAYGTLNQLLGVGAPTSYGSALNSYISPNAAGPQDPNALTAPTAGGPQSA